MGDLIYREVVAGDAAALSQLLMETPMGERVRVSQDRGADFFSTSLRRREIPAIWAAFEKSSGRAIGLFSAGARSVFIDGDIRSVRYLSDLRIHPDYRGGMTLARGFRILRKRVFQEGEWAQTIVLDDNPKAKEVLTSGRGGLPFYHPCGKYQTWFLVGQAVRAKEFEIRKGLPSDARAMQELLESEGPSGAFTPWFDFSNTALQDFRLAFFKEELVGMLRSSESGVFRVSGYRVGIHLARPLYNVFAYWTGIPQLPKVGKPISPTAIGSVVCRNRDPEIFRALMADTLKGNGFFAVGLDPCDPLAKGMKGMRAHLTRAGHYQVGFSGNPFPVNDPVVFDYGSL